METITSKAPVQNEGQIISEPFAITRRHFFSTSARGLGAMALTSLLPKISFAGTAPKSIGGLPGFPNFAPKAKRVIYLFQSGAPSQMELFDYKPRLADYRAQNLPDSIRMGQRLTGMTSGQKSFPVAPSAFQFAQHGKSGVWLSELLPHTAK